MAARPVACPRTHVAYRMPCNPNAITSMGMDRVAALNADGWRTRSQCTRYGTTTQSLYAR